MDIFTLNNLCAAYEDREVLHNINLSVRKGEFLALIGPNGAGKSTLLRVMAGNLAPAGGSVLFREQDIKRYRARALAREMSMVHQSMDQVQAFTVRGFVALGRFPHQKAWEMESREDAGVIEEALELCGIASLRDRVITELSGGELQLACIARALTQNRDLILLDEPVSHLDVKHTLQIMDILHGLNRRGSTIITVLHDLNLASDYCTRITGLRDGRVFLDGAPGDVITYDRIEALFDIVCVVRENPISGRPFAYGVPGHVKKS